MSELSAYEKLGVSEDASFEEIQAAKQRLTQKYLQDVQVIETIEAAYDAIIMDRLKLRQEGRIKIPDQIRFPENTREENFGSNSPNFSLMKRWKQAPIWLQNLIELPSLKELGINGVIFLSLIIIAIFSSASQTLSLLLLVGLGANFYLLYRKNGGFWRSAGFTLLGLIIGVFSGGVLANLISSFGLSSDQFSCFATFLIFWLISSFLR
jgi:hypothetical protein